ncbi:MAG: hypothetical protein P8075_02630 [Deltaproteobacteria bacterium]|jgi:hypothetical protein
MTSEEREKIGAELEERHGEAIRVFSKEVYQIEPRAIGMAVTYFDCGCVLLRAFDESADITGDPGVIESAGSCKIDHGEALKHGSEAGAYQAIFWKDGHEEFDRKYGNQQRVIIARKLFPPQEEE